MSIFKEISHRKKSFQDQSFCQILEKKEKNFYNQLEEWTSHIVGGTRLSEILFVRNFSKEKLERGDLGRQDYI